MISSGDNVTLKILDTNVRRERVWGSGVRWCGSYWIGLEKVACFALPRFGYPQIEPGYAVVLVGGQKVLDKPIEFMDEAMNLIECELRRQVKLGAYGKESLKQFQGSTYFNRGEMPVDFKLEA